MALSRADTFQFDRRIGADTMPRGVFVATLSFFIAGGLASAAIVASMTYGMAMSWMWLIGYFVVAIPGILLSAGSTNPLVSTIGYSLVIAATGAIMGPFVAAYELGVVINAAALTFGATVALGVGGALYPKSVEHWGGFLFAALGLLIVAQILDALLIYFGVTPAPMGILDWLGALLFSAYIFYDMNRAMRMPATLDNAVDAAVSLYLDIINLFIRIVSIMGSSND